jgi:hypothetical protein
MAAIATTCPVLTIPDGTWIAFIIMVLFVIITKISAKIFNKTEIEAWAEIEKQNLVMILLIILAVIGFMNGFSLLLSYYINQHMPTLLASYSPCPAINLIEISQNILNNLMNNRFIPAFGKITHLIHGFEIFSGYSVKAIGVPGTDVSQRLTAGFDVVVQPLILVRDLFPLLITSIGFQLIVYDFLLLFYHYLFPISLILLVIRPTRQLGIEMISIIFSLVIFMPAFFIIMHIAVEDVGQKTGLIQSITKAPGILNNIISALESIYFLTLAYGILFSVLSDAFRVTTELFAYASLVSVLIPTFVLITSITFTKVVSNVLSSIT